MGWDDFSYAKIANANGCRVGLLFLYNNVTESFCWHVKVSKGFFYYEIGILYSHTMYNFSHGLGPK